MYIIGVEQSTGKYYISIVSKLECEGKVEVVEYAYHIDVKVWMYSRLNVLRYVKYIKLKCKLD